MARPLRALLRGVGAAPDAAARDELPLLAARREPAARDVERRRRATLSSRARPPRAVRGAGGAHAGGGGAGARRTSELTYARAQRARQSAGALLARSSASRPGLVGLCVERSLEMVIGLLGILKAGGAYVPLDPSYPAERLRVHARGTRGHGRAGGATPTAQARGEPLPGAGGPVRCWIGCVIDDLDHGAGGRCKYAGDPTLPLVRRLLTTPGVRDLHVRVDRAAQGRDARTPQRVVKLRCGQRASSRWRWVPGTSTCVLQNASRHRSDFDASGDSSICGAARSRAGASCRIREPCRSPSRSC